MVYHSIPDSSKTYPDHMKNREISHFEIQKVTYTADGLLVERVEAIVTIYQTISMNLNRDQLINQMRQQGTGMYFKSKELHLDWIGLIPFVHFEKSPEARDILE
jgi:hypothetical protein